MWPVLLVLAMVPMIFFWSDSVRDMFPALTSYLPDKQTELPASTPANKLHAKLAEGLAPGKWYESSSDQGYVAWVMSEDRQYRLSVGCRPSAPATLQVTHVSGATLPDRLHLNYQYGLTPLQLGYTDSIEIVGITAQFKDVYLQGDSGKEVHAQFTVPAKESNHIARQLQANCTISQ